ncbi:MAG: hypothetical protein DRP63_08490 [Planctomycetota bacterium]|nr:MAG: hypothetical protein DRP63_08490 [Planctomycetota bacterium]
MDAESIQRLKNDWEFVKAVFDTAWNYRRAERAWDAYRKTAPDPSEQIPELANKLLSLDIIDVEDYIDPFLCGAVSPLPRDAFIVDNWIELFFRITEEDIEDMYKDLIRVSDWQINEAEEEWKRGDEAMSTLLREHRNYVSASEEFKAWFRFYHRTRAAWFSYVAVQRKLEAVDR